MRRLAVPFLMTASVSAPAAAQPAPEPAREVRVFRNPPRPHAPKLRPPVPDRVEIPGGHIQRDKNDNCRKIIHSKCPEGAKCNPPRPQWVACPPELLNWAKPHEKVTTRADGTCHVDYDVKCPPGVMCNPPPPKRVRCPGDNPPVRLVAPPVPASQPASATSTPPAPTK